MTKCHVIGIGEWMNINTCTTCRCNKWIWNAIRFIYESDRQNNIIIPAQVTARSPPSPPTGQCGRREPRRDAPNARPARPTQDKLGRQQENPEQRGPAVCPDTDPARTEGHTLVHHVMACPACPLPISNHFNSTLSLNFVTQSSLYFVDASRTRLPNAQLSQPSSPPNVHCSLVKTSTFLALVFGHF